MWKREKGFTLMELMVVIVIVAILAAVAVPLYVNYVRDAQNTEAKGAIGAVITAEQTYYQVNGTYYLQQQFQQNPTPQNQTLNCDLTDALANWNITMTSADQNGFIVEARGLGRPNGPSAQRLVRLTYSRTNPPIWFEQ